MHIKKIYHVHEWFSEYKWSQVYPLWLTHAHAHIAFVQIILVILEVINANLNRQTYYVYIQRMHACLT